MTHLLRSVGELRSRGRPNWVIVPRSVLELLAQLLAIPTSSLLATTYQLELAGLYDSPNPHATYLCRSFPFHLCPECIAEGRLLRRTLILPHITFCPSHRVALVGICQCGTPLQLFARQTLPFTCQMCYLDWAKLPRFMANQERLALERKLLSYYAFFFDHARPTIIAKAQQVVRDSMKRAKIDRVEFLDRRMKYVELYDAKRMSLGHLVEALISLDLSLNDITAYNGPLPWWSMKNRTEERSSSDDNEEIAVSGGASTDNN